MFPCPISLPPLGPCNNPNSDLYPHRMRYRALAINLFSCISDHDRANNASQAPKTPESPPRNTPESKYNAWEVTQSAARSIAALVQLLRREHGLSRAHHFAMYCINLALFTLLEHPAFDILDHDFLSLVGAFSVIASRSPLGRNIFHLFRQSVRSTGQGERLREFDGVDEDLKALFTDDPSRIHTRFDGYADGLEKLNQDSKYHGIGQNGSTSLQDYPGLNLFEMLDRYESLSLGKDNLLSERRSERC